jgi:hypothetical protein
MLDENHVKASIPISSSLLQQKVMGRPDDPLLLVLRKPFKPQPFIPGRAHLDLQTKSISYRR